MPDHAASSTLNVPLERSYAACLDLARSSRSNFYGSFFALPRPLFRDTCVLYAYLRLTDDLGDDEAIPVDERRQQLRDWRAQLGAALEGRFFESQSPIYPALVDVCQRHAVPHQYLYDVITGVESDLAPRRFADLTALERYCYHVAGVVGLACVHIWGFDDSPTARHLATRCGLAFQLINILRDVREDALRGRVYLPQDLLQRHACPESELVAEEASPRLKAVVLELARQAQEFHAEAAELCPHLSGDGRRVYEAMHRLYGDLLRQILVQQGDVFARRPRLSGWLSTKTIAVSICRRWLGR